MQIEILTLFPEYFRSPLAESLLGKAIAAGRGKLRRAAQRCAARRRGVAATTGGTREMNRPARADEELDVVLDGHRHLRDGRLRSLPLVPVLLLHALGCGKGDPEEPAPSDSPVRVEVPSHHALPVEIYAVGTGTRQRLGALSKQGNPFLRFLWCEATLHAVRLDSALQRFYRRKLHQKGLAKARVAAARKLGIRLWIMLRDQINYDEFCRRGGRRSGRVPCGDALGEQWSSA